MLGRRVTFAMAGALVATALALPVATAHSPTDPLEVETHLLQDEGEDAFYWFDGYDLYDLMVREAYWEPLNQEGLIFRFTLYGGFAPQHLAKELHIDIGVTTTAGEHLMRITTSDDATWSGDLEVVMLEVTPDAPPFTGVTARLQAFVSYDALGVVPGDTLSAFRMVSSADDDVLDVAPGGWFPPGPAPVEVPGDSKRLVEELTLAGPVGYMEVTHDLQGGKAVFFVKNAFEHQGQHVAFHIEPTEGWDLGEGAIQSLELGASKETAFVVTATPGAAARAPLRVELATDMGGHAWYFVGHRDGAPVVGATADEAPVLLPQDAPKSTPGPSAWMGALALAAVALALARRR